MRYLLNYLIVITLLVMVAACTEDARTNLLKKAEDLNRVAATPTVPEATITVVNKSRSPIENPTFYLKYARRGSDGQMSDFWHFPSSSIAPGNYVNLRIPADLYSKVTCVSNGRIKRIKGALNLSGGQVVTLEVR